MGHHEISHVAPSGTMVSHVDAWCPPWGTMGRPIGHHEIFYVAPRGKGHHGVPHGAQWGVPWVTMKSHIWHQGAP